MTKNTYQFCWLWDKYCSIDVAAWMQAIGSIIAILVTVFLYYRQINEARNDRVKATQSKRNLELAVIQQFSKRANLLFHSCTRDLDNHNAVLMVWKEHLPKLKELETWRSFLIHDSLTNLEIEKLFRIYDALHSTQQFIENSKASFFGPDVDLQFLPNVLNGVQEDLNYFISTKG